MKHWGKDILRALRLKKGMSQQDLAAALGQSIRWVQNHEGKQSYDEKPEMHAGTVKQVAEALGVTMDELVTGTKPAPLPGQFTIPRVSGVAASDFREYPVDLMNREGVPGQLYPFPAHDPMVLRVAGSSMLWNNPDAIFDGDDVIFGNELEEDIPENTIVVARDRHTGTQTVKRLHYVDDHQIELVPHNPTFPRLKVKLADVVLRAVKVIVGYPYRRK